MDWTKAVRDAVDFMEKHMTEEITMEDVAAHVNMSPFYFHKGFSILCGYSMTEYIRNRRLALAGEELLTSDITVMELAMKYGYDSPDSFTKAFTRFHGHAPSTARRDRTMLKAFAPLKLSIYIYNPSVDVPEGYVVRTIPAFTWAVFPCKGVLSQTMQDVNTKVFSEWLPALQDYEFAAGYCVEMYDAPDQYPGGTEDENYYAEIWIPIRKKG